VLEVVDVSYSYGQIVALDGVSISAAAGEIVALLGPNGAGKTTFVSIVAGLLQPDRGSVSLAGVDVGSQPARARASIGLAPQELGLYPTATVRENLEFFESPWVRWRLLTLETRMEPCRRTRHQGSRRRVGTPKRRRPGRCGWFASYAPSWGPSTGR